MSKYKEQYNAFKDFCMRQSKEWIYQHYYKIGFYENVFDIFENCADYEDNVADIIKLINEDKTSMEDLFDRFLDLEWTTYDTWETVLDFFDYVIENSKK